MRERGCDEMSTNRARLKWKPRTKRAAPVVGNRVRSRAMTAEELAAMQARAAEIRKGWDR